MTNHDWDARVAERPANDPGAAYEATSVRASTGLEDEAEVEYQRALDLSLEEAA